MYKKSLYTLLLGVFPLLLCSGIVYSVLPLYISNELGASTSQLGAVYMVGAFVGFMLAPYLGKLADRRGKQIVLLFAMGGFGVAFAAYGTLSSLAPVYAVQAVEGASWAAMGATVPALIADIVPDQERGWAMGVYERTWSLGWIGGPLAGGLLAQHVGFRLTFVIGGALVMLGIFWLWRSLRKLQVPPPPASASCA
ncbi:MAG: MFS transporter [Dehalococcoidia bacterium]|nr:MFS transporter [Dehalococcoidia bacterium]MDP6782346.1 MFS transporter [Dehalococcoidia bacterium]